MCENPLALAFAAIHLFSITVVAASAWVFGDTVLRLCRIRSGDRHWALSTALGLGLIAQAMFFLGLSGFLQRPVVLTLLLVAHLPCFGTWIDVVRRRRRLELKSGPARLAGGATLVLSAVLALYPPTGFDATVYHLPFAEAMIEAGGLVFVPELRFPIFPQVVEMLFVLGFFLAGEATAQLTQVLSALLVAGLVADWGRRRFAGPVGLWAAALWLGTPIVVWIAASAYIDVGLALFVTAAFSCWERWLETRERRWIVIAGIFAGLAAGTKYLGLFFCAALGVMTLIHSRRARTLRPAAALTVAATLVLAPWYLHIVYRTGNPVFPFYAPIFGESEWTSEHDRALPDSATPAEVLTAQGGRIVDGLGFLLRVPWAAVFDRQVFHFQAPLSPFYLVLIPLCAPWALALPRARRLLLVTGVYLLFWLTTVRDLRFLFPVLPMLHLALAAGLERLTRTMRNRAFVLGLAALLLVPGIFYAGYKILERGPLPTTAAERLDYLDRQLPGHRTIRWLNETQGSDYTVYALRGERLTYSADGRFLGDLFGPMRYSKIDARLGDARQLHGTLREFGACYFLLPVDAAGRMSGRRAMRQHFELLREDADFVLFRLRAAGCSGGEPPR